MTTRKTIHFSGHVQGVGFRYTAQAVARDFDVVGYVKNLSDGRVKLEVEGEEAEVDRFVERIRRHMGGHIRHVDSVTSPATGDFSDFRVTH
jgi:acylphosphatase